MDGSSNNGSKKVQLIRVFSLGWIKMEKQDSSSRLQHSWDEALMMSQTIYDKGPLIISKYMGSMASEAINEHKTK